MWHLVKLELRRLKLGKLLVTWLVACLAVLAFVVLIHVEDTDTVEQAPPMVINTLIGATFIIYASVLLARMFVNEFRSKTIALLFMYPVDRARLLWSKLAIVCTFTFCAIITSCIAVTAAFYLLNGRFKFVGDPTPPVLEILMDLAPGILLYGICCAGLALIPLFFGMWKQSESTTIVTSMLMILLLNNGLSEEPSMAFISVSVGLAIVGFVIAHITVRRAIAIDL